MLALDDGQSASNPVPAGDASSVVGQIDLCGEKLEAFRAYLILQARRGLAPDMAAKVGASDLVQETYLAARRDIGQLRDHSPAKLRCWLEGILKHLLANNRRRYRATRKRRVDLEGARGRAGCDSAEGRLAELSSSATSPSDRAIRHEREGALRAAMMDLPERYRQVIQWHHEERLTFEEVGGRLGISAEASRKVWARALLRLRDAMGPGHDPER